MGLIVEQSQYKAERNQILKNLRDYHKAQGNDPKAHVGNFLNELTKAIQSIQADPCRYPDRPAPVKMKIFSRGTTQCVILFLPLPVNHMNNSSLVTEAHLTSIMLTTSGAYNLYVMQQLQAFDLDV